MACDANQKSSANAELTVNGEKVGMNKFVQGLISQTLIGMVKSLHGVDEIKTIKLKISRNSQEQ